VLQRVGGLALAGLARELIPLFEAAGVRVLVFKGPVLPALTCGDPGGWGGGDLDLLERPAVALAGAVACRLLEVRLPDPCDPARLSRRQRWAVEVASRTQRGLLFLHQRGPWRLNRAWDLRYQRVALISSPEDWLRRAAAYALPPTAFNDPASGEDRSLAAALASRLARVQ
jgi:hypothetical protein